MDYSFFNLTNYTALEKHLLSESYQKEIVSFEIFETFLRQVRKITIHREGGKI